MSGIDRSGVDVGLLQTLVAVMEAGGVTAAALRLGVSQSAVSHQLDRLRAAVDDPLFVRSGRGVAPTARAEDLAVRARELLVELDQFTRIGAFDPAHWQAVFVIAANTLQRDVLMPALVATLRQQAPGVNLRIVPSGVPTTAMLRSDQVQLVITPRPPHGEDILQLHLFSDRYRIFYDPTIRAAPADLAEYLAAEHVSVLYNLQSRLAFDDEAEERGVQRRFRVTVPGFDGLATFVRGSDLLTTAPGLLSRTVLRDLAHAPLPFVATPLPMFMVWHIRHRSDPAHRWVRRQIEAQARQLWNPRPGFADSPGPTPEP